jgi:hypothetical protein
MHNVSDEVYTLRMFLQIRSDRKIIKTPAKKV